MKQRYKIKTHTTFNKSVYYSLYKERTDHHSKIPILNIFIRILVPWWKHCLTSSSHKEIKDKLQELKEQDYYDRQRDIKKTKSKIIK